MSLYQRTQRLAEHADVEPYHKQTLYVSRPLLSVQTVVDWLNAQGIGTEQTGDTSRWHVTVAYSTNPVDWRSLVPDHNIESTRDSLGCEQFGEHNVLLLPETSFAARHALFRSAGASWDFPSYRPHVTIGNSVSPERWTALKPFAGKLIFGPELFDLVRD